MKNIMRVKKPSFVCVIFVLFILFLIFPSLPLKADTAPNISSAEYAPYVNTLLIIGSDFGATQGVSTVIIDLTNLGSANYWSATQIYFKTPLVSTGLIKVTVSAVESNSVEISRYSNYLAYPDDAGTDANMVSYWPMDSNFNDVKGSNNFDRRENEPIGGSRFRSGFAGTQIVAHADSKYYEWPWAGELANGDYLVMFTSGEGGEEKLRGVRSTDKGLTWSDVFLVYDPPEATALYGLFHESAIVLSDGSILAAYADNVGQAKVLKSTDNGYTWQGPYNASSTPYTVGAAFGRLIELSSGRILMPVWTDIQRSFVLKSDDGGLSWSYLSTIAYNVTSATPNVFSTADVGVGSITIPTGTDLATAGYYQKAEAAIGGDSFTYTGISGNNFTGVSGIDSTHLAGSTINRGTNGKGWNNFNEVSFSKAPDDNHLIAIIRSEDGTSHFYQADSYDQGATWSEPKIVFWSDGSVASGQGLFLFRHSSGRIYLLHRLAGPTFAYSDDNGATWTGWNYTFSSNPNYGAMDAAAGLDYSSYGSFIETDDGRIMLIYGLGNTYGYIHLRRRFIDPDSNYSGGFMSVSNSSLQLNQYTVDFWMKFDQTLNKNQTVIAKGIKGVDIDSHTYTNYMVELMGGVEADQNKVRVGQANTSGNLVWATSTTKLNEGEWYHIAGTYNGTTIKLYINGLLEAEQNSDLNTLQTCSLNIGAYSLTHYWRGVNFMYYGYLDNLKVYSAAISSERVLAHANYANPVIIGTPSSHNPQGSTASITGTGFGSGQGSSTFTVGGVAPTITSWSDTEIQFTVPSLLDGNYTTLLTINGNPSNQYTITLGQESSGNSNVNPPTSNENTINTINSLPKTGIGI